MADTILAGDGTTEAETLPDDRSPTVRFVRPGDASVVSLGSPTLFEVSATDDEPFPSIDISWESLSADGSFAAIPNLSDATWVPSSLAAGGQIRCRATPRNGTEFGDSVVSPVATVVNLKPTASAVLTPTPAFADTVLTCSGQDVSDLDGDSVSLEFGWLKNGVAIPEAIGATLQGSFSKGDEVRCVVTPSDGTAKGPAAISNCVGSP